MPGSRPEGMDKITPCVKTGRIWALDHEVQIQTKAGDMKKLAICFPFRAL